MQKKTRLEIRLSEEQKKIIQDIAKDKGITVSEYILLLATQKETPKTIFNKDELDFGTKLINQLSKQTGLLKHLYYIQTKPINYDEQSNEILMEIKTILFYMKDLFSRKYVSRKKNK